MALLWDNLPMHISNLFFVLFVSSSKLIIASRKVDRKGIIARFAVALVYVTLLKSVYMWGVVRNSTFITQTLPDASVIALVLGISSFKCN